MNRRWVAPTLAIVIVAMLGADAGVVLARMGDDVTPVTREVPDHLKPVLAEVSAFVEQARGLKFKRPPNVALVPDDEFDTILQGDVGAGEDADLEGQEAYLGVMRALGLLEETADLDAGAQDQLSRIIGYYNFETKALYVRGVEVTPYAKEILAHELTHALDDQHFGLLRSDLRESDDTDALAAFQALIEGDAVNVQLQWHASRSPEEREVIEAADLEAAGGLDDDGSVPDVFALAGAFPYVVGPRFVADLRDEGGQAALDAAFRRLPTTTEQILHPTRYVAREGAAKVPDPPAGGKVVGEGTLGELGLILVTGTAVPEDDALRAAAGWAGDSYRAWNEGDRTCVRWHIQMDSPGDAADLVEVLGYWANDNPGAVVAGTDPVEVTNCG